MTTNEKGAIGLAKVISDVTEKLFQVFLPLTDTSIIDLIIVNKELVSKKLQIKYLSLNKTGSVIIQCESVINRKRVLNDFSKIDGIAIYCPDNKQLYYVPVSEITGKSLSLKITENKKGGKSLKYGEDFLEINNLF